jgi:hypothetical protein
MKVKTNVKAGQYNSNVQVQNNQQQNSGNVTITL